MFIGRSAELKKLNEMYISDKFECAIIYGRRRVGKTTLIREFIKDKTAIYFAAREAGGAVNLSGFSNDVYSVTAKELAKNAFFADWEKAFDYIYQISQDNRIVLGRVSNLVDKALFKGMFKVDGWRGFMYNLDINARGYNTWITNKKKQKLKK